MRFAVLGKLRLRCVPHDPVSSQLAVILSQKGEDIPVVLPQYLLGNFIIVRDANETRRESYGKHLRLCGSRTQEQKL